MLSDDSGCVSDMSEYEIDRVEKFVRLQKSNSCTKYCAIYNYYTTDGTLTYLYVQHA